MFPYIYNKVARSEFLSSFLEATNANGGMSLSNNFVVKVLNSSNPSLTEEFLKMGIPNYGGSGADWFEFLCDEAQLPNTQAATGTLKGRYLGEGEINYPHTRVFTEFQLGFQCDATLTPLNYLNNWFHGIFGEVPEEAAGFRADLNARNQSMTFNRSNRLAYPQDYCKDIMITKTEQGPNSTTERAGVTYSVERAWPYAIDAVPLQFGTAQITKVTAQFYYTRHHVIHAIAPETTQKAKLKMINDAQKFTGQQQLNQVNFDLA